MILAQLPIDASMRPVHCDVDIFSNHPQVKIRVPLFQRPASALLTFWVE